MTSQNTHDKILQAAEKEFMRVGYAGARTTSIAEAAGVTPAMLHYYFRTKENLFDSIISNKMQLLGKLVIGSIDALGLPLAERLKLMIDTHIDFIARNPDLPHFVISEVYSRPDKLQMITDVLRKHANRTITRLQADIDGEAEQGKCRRVDAFMLMVDIISLNIFALLAYPMIERLLPDHISNFDSFLNERKKENFETIMRKLKP